MVIVVLLEHEFVKVNCIVQKKRQRMLLPSTFKTIPTWFLPIPENTAPALGIVNLSNLFGCAFSSSSTQSHPFPVKPGS